MSTISTARAGLPRIVPQAEWQQALADVTDHEKSLTHATQKLAAERRRLPMVRIEQDYRFDSSQGKVSLHDLFEGRPQLIVYHFMFAPGVGGWPTAGCVGCSLFVDQIGHPAHLHARDVSLALVSLGPLDQLQRYRQRMGWTLPWVSSAGSSFNQDMGVSRPDGETHGLSVFLRDGDAIYRTYFTTDRGCEALGTVWSLLDLTPWGRQEEWEETPAGRPQSKPYVWWRRHDEYDQAAKG